MKDHLAKKTAIITGGASGIGEATARQMAQEGPRYSLQTSIARQVRNWHRSSTAGVTPKQSSSRWT